MEKTLILNLKKKWFDLIKKGIKKEEYREIKPFYNSRFLGHSLKYKQNTDEYYDYIIELTESMGHFFSNQYNKLILKMGYPSKNEKDKILIFNNPIIEIGYGKLEWGADPNKLYYIIKF